MPRVTEEHRSARREQILNAALLCVARDGFHKTTMAAVIGESGLSAGAVYRYFNSKEDILHAIAERSIGRIDETFRVALADDAVPHPADVLAAALDRLLNSAPDTGIDITVVVVQAWAEAVRGGEILDVVAPRVHEVREHLVEVMRRFQAAGHIEPAADPEQLGRVVLALLPGFILQRLLLGGVEVDSFSAAARSLIDSCSDGRDRGAVDQSASDHLPDRKS